MNEWMSNAGNKLQSLDKYLQFEQLICVALVNFKKMSLKTNQAFLGYNVWCTRVIFTLLKEELQTTTRIDARRQISKGLAPDEKGLRLTYSRTNLRFK